MKTGNRSLICKQAVTAAISMAASIAFVFAQPKKAGDADITAQQVSQAFAKAGASSQHPRLFFNAADINRVKTLLAKKDPIVTIAFEDLKKDAATTLKQPLLQYHLDAAKLRVPSVHTFAKQLPALVMMYQLTGDTMYAARVWKQFEVMAAYPDWGANRHFLDAGIGAFNFALAYDGLYDYLTPAQRKVVEEGVSKHVFAPGYEQLKSRTWWATANHNWNGICNGGVIMAALAMFETEPERMSELVAMAANGLPHYIKAFEPDGQSDEGLMYWGYGLMYTTIAFESMQRSLGTTFQLNQTPGFLKTGWFPLYVSGPVTSLSFGDDPVKDSRTRSFFWFAKAYNDTALAKLQYDLCLETKGATWMDMLYYDPGMIKQSNVTAKLKKDTYVRGIEVMALRENWNKDALFLSVHGGHNNANHGHLDAGSFDLQANGEVWGYGDLGRDDYTFPGYFSKTTWPSYMETGKAQDTPGRWHFYRLRAEGKNCVVINPSRAPDQNEQGVAQLVSHNSTKEKGFYVVDLKSCYNRDVTAYHRGIAMDRKMKVMTVQDDIVAKKPSDIWWSMHTKADIKISKDGREATLKQNGKTLKAVLVSPANTSFSVLPATYLPGQQFPLTKNSPNKGFSKLAIHLKEKTQTTIRVDFTEGNVDAWKNETIKPLAQWK